MAIPSPRSSGVGVSTSDLSPRSASSDAPPAARISAPLSSAAEFVFYARQTEATHSYVDY